MTAFGEKRKEFILFFFPKKVSLQLIYFAEYYISLDDSDVINSAVRTEFQVLINKNGPVLFRSSTQ